MSQKTTSASFHDVVCYPLPQGNGQEIDFDNLECLVDNNRSAPQFINRRSNPMPLPEHLLPFVILE